MFVLTVEQIARVCHEANRAYCMSIGDFTQPTWDMAPPWQRESAIEGVRAAVANPDRTPEDSHEEWMALKLSQGWKHGPVKAPDLKEHPCLVPHDELPEEQQAKDYLFLAAVGALREHTFDQKKGMIMEAAKPVPPPGEDSTEETGIITEEGEMLKGGELETTVKGGTRKKRSRKKKDTDETPATE